MHCDKQKIKAHKINYDPNKNQVFYFLFLSNVALSQSLFLNIYPQF